ncbi:MAG: 50S ribosomal protein L11 methyltransferase [Bryobacterales bacterium]|nr:50S ribosomal protein L11 methyltransferase [Bryobacterales bacterium]
MTPPEEALEVLVELGALDVEAVGEGIAAILPDAVLPERLKRLMAGASVSIARAVERDDGSVWLLSARPARIGGLVIGGPEMADAPNAVRLMDSGAFGTGHHPTTALCIEAIEELVGVERIEDILDVGTGSGVLALCALKLGVARAVGVDIDGGAIAVAAGNARLNGLGDRVRLVHGGPDAVEGVWPLVVANVLAAPLIEMAGVIVRRVASRGTLILSGIPCGVEEDVKQAYLHLGMHDGGSRAMGGWTALTLRASW